MLILLTRLRGRTKIIFKDSLSLYLFIYLFIVLLPLVSIVLNSVAFLFACFYSALLFTVFFFAGFHFLLFYSYHSIFYYFFLVILLLLASLNFFLKNVYEVFECYLKSILLQFMD